jgi:hypothetical protein
MFAAHQIAVVENQLLCLVCILNSRGSSITFTFPLSPGDRGLIARPGPATDPATPVIPPFALSFLREHRWHQPVIISLPCPWLGIAVLHAPVAIPRYLASACFFFNLIQRTALGLFAVSLRQDKDRKSIARRAADVGQQ